MDTRCTFDLNVDDEQPKGLLRTSLHGQQVRAQSAHETVFVASRRKRVSAKRREGRQESLVLSSHCPQLRYGELSECQAGPTEETLD